MNPTSLSIRAAIAAAAVCWPAVRAEGQPAPLNLRTGGVLVGDLTLDAIYLTRDLNSDGDADDPGEATVWFDGTNASGLPAPTTSVFRIYQSASGHVYFGDGGADTVYRLRDLNGDGDALDAGEASVWFSDAANFHAFRLLTPNGLYEDAAGALYIVNAGTLTIAVDAVYRTVDLNSDGDANDENEATLWFDMQNLVPSSSAFEIVFMGDIAFISDTVGGEPDAVWYAKDADLSGTIDAGEFHAFIDDNNPYGVPVATGLVTDGTSLYVSESLTASAQTVYRLTDLNQNGVIDDPAEAVQVWNESLVPAGFELGTSFGLGIGPGGELAVGSAGSDVQDNVFRLVDGNADGDFLDPGETIVWASGHGAGAFIENPRALEYILPPAACATCRGDVNGDGFTDGGDVFGLVDCLLGGAGPCGCADMNGDGSVTLDDLPMFVDRLVQSPSTACP